MAELQERKAAFDAAEQKMMRMEPLTDEEQELYDLTSGDAIQEKLTWLSAHCKAMVENGEITMGEKQQLREQVSEDPTQTPTAAPNPTLAFVCTPAPGWRKAHGGEGGAGGGRGGE